MMQPNLYARAHITSVVVSFEKRSKLFCMDHRKPGRLGVFACTAKREVYGWRLFLPPMYRRGRLCAQPSCPSQQVYESQMRTFPVMPLQHLLHSEQSKSEHQEIQCILKFA